MFSGQNCEIVSTAMSTKFQLGERVGQGGWLIGPKLFRPEAYPAGASSKLCEFITMYCILYIVCMYSEVVVLCRF